MWNSAEGPETYANCLDLRIEGDPPSDGGGGGGGGNGGEGAAGAGQDSGGGPSSGTIAAAVCVSVVVLLLLAAAICWYRRKRALPKTPPPPPPGGDLPTGWSQAKDPTVSATAHTLRPRALSPRLAVAHGRCGAQSGQTYYINSATRESQWERPMAGAKEQPTIATTKV